MEVVTRFVAQQSTRNREVLNRRFGLTAGSRSQTLDAIGRSLGLTRERIRQIVVKLQARLATHLRRAWPGLMPQLKEHLERVGVAAVPEIVTLIPYFGESTKFHLSPCVRLVLTSFPGIHAIDPTRELWSTDPSINADLYRETINAAKVTLRGGPTDLEEVVIETAKRLHRAKDLRAIGAILHSASSTFAVQPNQRVALRESQSIQDKRRVFAFD
jgi:hypothetical protein